MKSAGIALISAVGLVVGILIYQGLKPAPLRPPTEAQIKAEVDRLQAEAQRSHPGMPASDAMKEVATRQAREAMARGDAHSRAQTAAGIFYGAYLLNTRARPAWCRQRGVDLTPFAQAYETAHRDELVRAQAIFAEAGLKPETFAPQLEAQFLGMVEQDMRDFSSGARVPLAQACGLFNEKAPQLAKAIALPPEVRQALFAAR